MLEKKWFEFDVPVNEQSMNEGQGALFPFWSSNAITEIMSITALSKYLKAMETLNSSLKPHLSKE